MKRPPNKKIIEVLTNCAGLMKPAADKLNVSRCTLYEWCKKDPELEAAKNAARDAVVDMAESKLFKKVKDGDLIATLFLLKTLGKDRGYVERQEKVLSGTVTPPELTITIEGDRAKGKAT